MTPDDKQELLQAVNALIMSPDAHELHEALEAAPNHAGRFGVLLSGEAAVLNPLLALRRRDRDAYLRVIELVETRRAERGYDALREETPTGFDKVEYQRGFMAQKRERQRVAVEIENLLRPERDRLIGNARLDFMRRQSTRWKEARDALLAKAKEADGGTLTKERTNQVLAQFWTKVDADLEERMAKAKAASSLPRSAKAAGDVSLNALADALKHDPYRK